MAPLNACGVEADAGLQPATCGLHAAPLSCARADAGTVRGETVATARSDRGVIAGPR